MVLLLLMLVWEPVGLVGLSREGGRLRRQKRFVGAYGFITGEMGIGMGMGMENGWQNIKQVWSSQHRPGTGFP